MWGRGVVYILCDIYTKNLKSRSNALEGPSPVVRSAEHAGRNYIAQSTRLTLSMHPNPAATPPSSLLSPLVRKR